MWGEPVGHHFGNNFHDGMDKTDGSKVRYIFSPIFLRNEGDIRGIELMEMGGMQVREATNGRHEIFLDNVPACFKESTGEAIRARGFIRR